jgi:hypothetical protein
MSATVDFARLATLQSKGSNLTSEERAEYIKLLGEAQSFTFNAGKHASSVGIKVASPEQSELWANAVNVLIYNIECQLRYSANVVCGNQVAILNTLATTLGIPTHDSPMQWYAALATITGAMAAPTHQGIDKGRARNTWVKPLTDYAGKHGKPVSGPIDLAEFIGKPVTK